MSAIDQVNVVFRVFKEGDVIALFPDTGSAKTLCVTSYQHIGQHSDADYDAVIKITDPAEECEYKPLLQELKSVGYNPIVKKKAKVKYS